MIKTLTLATIIGLTLTGVAMSEEAKTTITRGTDPTGIMTGQVPQMKTDADADSTAAQKGDKQLPSAKAMNEAVPSMHPGDGESGQADSKSTGATSATQAAAPAAAAPVLTAQGEKAWFDKPVFSSDGQNLGEVVSFQRDAENNVVGMHADIGGFLGYGQTSVAVRADQFKLSGDRVLLGLTAKEAKDLPRI